MLAADRVAEKTEEDQRSRGAGWASNSPPGKFDAGLNELAKRCSFVQRKLDRVPPSLARNNDKLVGHSCHQYGVILPKGVTIPTLCGWESRGDAREKMRGSQQARKQAGAQEMLK